MRIFLTILFVVMCALVVLPFVLLVSVSLSDEKDVILIVFLLIKIIRYDTMTTQ